VYSEFEEPSDDVWTSALAKAKDFDSSIRTSIKLSKKVQLSSASNVGENFTSVLKRAVVEGGLVDG